ncbi:MAG: MerR family transcriptional regulator [Actinobacteria bacterium]|nr:MAG: MerR family transcriptional regulator [Actinomycetota bacterium]
MTRTSSVDAGVETGFRGPTVCRTVGISYRQLDYWARTELVTPSVRDADGSGSQRMYSFNDVVQLRVIKKLIDAGVSLPKIRRAVDYLRDELKMPIEDVTLVSDGKTIHACLSANEVVDLLAGGQGVFAIAVGKVYEELQGRVRAFPTAEQGKRASNEDTTEAQGS